EQTFYLGKDYAAACQRVLLVEKLWGFVYTDWHKYKRTDCPCWDETTLAIAFAIAKGEEEAFLSVPESVKETASALAEGDQFIGLWLRSLQEAYPFIRLKLADAGAHAVAVEGALTLAQELESDMASVKNTANRLRGQASGEMLSQALKAFLGHVERKYG